MHAADGDALSPESRRLHRALLTAYIETGEAADAPALAQRARIPVATVPARCRELARGGYAHFDAAGQLVCLLPFSIPPTPHVVTIAGRRRFAMCAIDALGVPAMVGQPVTVESVCARCGVPIRLSAMPSAVVPAQPGSALVVAGEVADQPGQGACCHLTGFACGAEHAAQLARQAPRCRILTPAEAQHASATLFGRLLTADSLPARLLPDAAPA